MRSITLNELNLEELEAGEAIETNGGLFWAAVAAGAAIAAITQVIQDWDNFKRGITGEPEIPKA
jgi:hypothetical protein